MQFSELFWALSTGEGELTGSREEKVSDPDSGIQVHRRAPAALHTKSSEGVRTQTSLFSYFRCLSLVAVVLRELSRAILWAASLNSYERMLAYDQFSTESAEHR